MSEVPAGWEKKSIGELCRLINGRAFKPREWSNKGLPIIRIQNLNDPAKPFNHFSGDLQAKHLVEDGDILLSWSGTPGTSFGCFQWSRGLAALNQHIFKVEVDESQCDPLYFMYAVNNALDDMIEQAHGGVGLRHITKKKLERIELPIAPLAEQRRLVAHIRSCLDRVEEIKRLRVEARREVDELFGSFAYQKYAELLDRFDTVPLAEVTQIESGKTPSKKNDAYWGGDFPWVSPKDMKALELSDSQDHIADMAIEANAAKLIEPPVVLVVVRGMILAHTLPVAISRVPLAINQDIKALTPSSRLLADFLAFMLIGAAPHLLKVVNTAGHGTKRLRTEDLLHTPIPVPPRAVQQAVSEEMFRAKKASESLLSFSQDEAPDQLTSAILRKAFAGEL